MYKIPELEQQACEKKFVYKRIWLILFSQSIFDAVLEEVKKGDGPAKVLVDPAKWERYESLTKEEKYKMIADLPVLPFERFLTRSIQTHTKYLRKEYWHDFDKLESDVQFKQVTSMPNDLLSAARESMELETEMKLNDCNGTEVTKLENSAAIGLQCNYARNASFTH